MSATLRVKNWETFQHYKLRSPPWIKLHREIVNDYAFTSLRDKTKAHLMLIWVLAAGNEGIIPHDETFISRRIGATERIDLDAIIAAGFLEVIDADGVIDVAPAPKHKPSKKPKREAMNGSFEIFYAAYPRRENRKDAEQAWSKLNPDEELQQRILNAIELQRKSQKWMDEGGKYIPHPASWLNKHRWEDEAMPAKTETPSWHP